MKFEMPIMNISKFELENVVTASGETPVEPVKPTAEEYAKNLAADKVITLTF